MCPGTHEPRSIRDLNGRRVDWYQTNKNYNLTGKGRREQLLHLRLIVVDTHHSPTLLLSPYVLYRAETKDFNT